MVHIENVGGYLVAHIENVGGQLVDHIENVGGQLLSIQCFFEALLFHMHKLNAKCHISYHYEEEHILSAIDEQLPFSWVVYQNFPWSRSSREGSWMEAGTGNSTEWGTEHIADCRLKYSI